MDPLSLTQRGHTGGTWHLQPVREQPYAYIQLVIDRGHEPPAGDDLDGPLMLNSGRDW